MTTTYQVSPTWDRRGKKGENKRGLQRGAGGRRLEGGDRNPKRASPLLARRRVHERREFRLVEAPVCPHPGTNIDAKRGHLGDRRAYIRRVEAAGEIDRDSHRFANCAADLPVMGAPGAAKLFYGQRWV